MWRRCNLLWMFLASSVSVCAVGRATAEIMSALLPDGVPGYDTEPGVTVETRLHPDQVPEGLRDGPLVARPSIEERFGYISNALPGPYRRGSWLLGTAPSLGLLTDWSRHALGALFSVDDVRMLSAPSQSRTDMVASAGGRLDVGDDSLTVAAAHIVRHEDRSGLDTIASDQPVRFQIDDLRAAYVWRDGRLSVEPGIEATNWIYDATTILGRPASQAYRDRIVLQGGTTIRYEWAPRENLVLVLRALGQDYTRTPPGQLSPNSVSYQVLAGLADDSDPVWHWRVLLGAQSQHFSAYPSRNTLITEAGLSWSPTGLTTVSARISRGTDAAAQEGVSGQAYTQARIAITHEYLRDVLLHAALGWQEADFFQGGYQRGFSFGLGIDWVLNRFSRLSVTYDQIDLRGSAFVGTTPSPGYSRGLGLVTLRMGL